MDNSRRITGTYKYYAADGTYVYTKHRIEPGRRSAKEFCFYHGDGIKGRGGYPTLYNLPAVIKANAVIFTEGEKQADILTGWGLCGTTFDSGSNSKFPDAMADYLRGKRVAILRDNDPPGLVYAEMIAKRLYEICQIIKIVLLPNLPEKGDLCDWNGDKNTMLKIIRATEQFVFVPEQIKPEPTRIKKYADNGSRVTQEMISAAALYPANRLLEFHHNYAKCLWHDDEKASLHYHAGANKAKCFACGKYASSIDILMRRDNVDFPAAVLSLL